MIDPNEQMEHDAADFSLHKIDHHLLEAQIEHDKLRRKIEAQIANLEIGVSVLWKVVEHGPVVVGHLTTEQLEWYVEFVVPKLGAWGKL